MAIDKSKWNTNIKVSQKTIDSIKKMGMKKALGTVAGSTKASKMDASAKAWTEGVKRVYGANRVSAAVKTGTVKYSSADAARGASASKPKSTVKYSSADAAKNAASKPKAKTSIKPSVSSVGNFVTNATRPTKTSTPKKAPKISSSYKKPF